MRRSFLYLILVFTLLGSSFAQPPSSAEVIERARATRGTEKALNNLVTIKMLGKLEPADTKVPAATVLIIARKPHSQRLEIRVDEMVETTILNGRKACIIRSNLEQDASQMRPLTGPELERVYYSTRQFFNFYRPDYKNGERATYEGTATHRGKRCHKIKYSYPEGEGLETIRYFSVSNDTLVATVRDNGVESVSRGEQLVNGIKYPNSIDYYEDGQKLHTIHFTEIEINQPLTAGIFSIPKGYEK